MTKRVLITVCLLVLLLPIFAVLCIATLAAFAGGSAGGTLESGRSVMTHSDSMSLSSEFGRDIAIIKTGGKTIVVKPTTLFVDGANVGTIDEKVAVVQVTVKHGKVTFVADGKTVATRLR